MIPLSDAQIAEYFHRSYNSIDGLWFMKSEERFDFDTALDVDTEVWKVMPKIQARKLKSLAGLGDGLDALRECFVTKLELEGFTFAAHQDADGRGFEIVITRCPWNDLMVQANRRHLAGKVGARICNAEYAVWASEFGEGIRFGLNGQLCDGCESCTIRFTKEAAK